MGQAPCGPKGLPGVKCTVPSLLFHAPGRVTTTAAKLTSRCVRDACSAGAGRGMSKCRTIPGAAATSARAAATAPIAYETYSNNF